jgi:hypothetical protein
VRATRAAALAVLAVLGCGGPRTRIVDAADRGDVADALARYDELARADGDDLELLARVALAVLEAATASDDAEVRGDAVRELATGGTLAEPALERIARGTGPSAMQALAALGRRGHADSLRMLRGLVEHADAEVRAAAVLALDPREDRSVLFALCAETSAVVRASATLRLGALGPDDAEALALLEERARVDPEPSVRAAAVRALGSYEAAAISGLRDRLSDPSASVRFVVLEALVRADREGARATIGSLLAMPPAMESIEAARILASTVGGPAEVPSDADREIALAYLRQALYAPDPNLRSQAGIALVGIPGRDDLLADLGAALGRETDADATLSLARAILRRDATASDARDRLRALAADPTGLVGVQAAIELASHDEPAGLDALRAAIGGIEGRLRRLAVHALARDARRPAETRPLLEDGDPRVRVAAAGGIVAAYAAR